MNFFVYFERFTFVLNVLFFFFLLETDTYFVLHCYELQTMYKEVITTL